ncbi:HAMP domain-containing histidine kinase [Fulvivirga ulvae]|uniref:sensor histidine kinase n=1 Tax=Fulvivirga ulvae TaxID=2904245 RepID=UPI001F2C9101|nr:HAMP domain-containing sensor histidine kinase [Fulvivirga ulvae]UII31269.1 HAMP domain-containing histidine kinase [Fulvivirga ulvae]
MKTTALIYSGTEELLQGNVYFNLKEILLYIFHRYVYRTIYRFTILLTFVFKPGSKRNRVTIKNEMPWFNYCIASMDKTIDNISTFNNTSNHQKMEYLNLRQMTDAIVRKRKRIADMIGVEIEVSIKNEHFIYVNKELLEVVIRNILDNAIQYSDDKKRKRIIYLSAVESWEHLYISIKDNGIGIPDKELNKIFRMFYKVVPTSPGLGAGLFLARKAIEKLNGSIDVISSAGLGSEFQIYLPSAFSVLQSRRKIYMQKGNK